MTDEEKIKQDASSLKDWYMSLDEQSKKKQREQYDRLFNKGREKPYVLSDDKNLQILVSGAEELIQAHPDEMVFALGRSPLWLVETARILEEDQKKGSGNRFEYVAFSGRWYEEDRSGSMMNDMFANRGHRLKKGPVFPKPEQIFQYREYLTNIGLGLEKVKERLARGQKTVIVERTHGGESLVSFLEVVREWTDYPTNALVIYVLKSPLMPNLTKQINIACPGVSVEIHEFEHVVGRELANSDDYKDSLGVHYPYWKWHETPPPQLADSANKRTNLIRFRILDFLKRK